MINFHSKFYTKRMLLTCVTHECTKWWKFKKAGICTTSTYTGNTDLNISPWTLYTLSWWCDIHVSHVYITDRTFKIQLLSQVLKRNLSDSWSFTFVHPFNIYPVFWYDHSPKEKFLFGVYGIYFLFLILTCIRSAFRQWAKFMFFVENQ